MPPNVSREHCRITVGDDGKWVVENISGNNLMFVNGREYNRKSGVKPSDTLELGPDRYRVDFNEVFKKAPALKPVYSIGHLESIFDSYQKAKIDLQVNQAKLNAISALPGVLSMISIGVAAFLPDYPSVRVVMILIAALFAFAFAIIRYKNARRIPLKSKEMEDRFREKYVCPNPDCRHFLGMTPYKELVKNGVCPYCKSKYKAE